MKAGLLNLLLEPLYSHFLKPHYRNQRYVVDMQNSCVFIPPALLCPLREYCTYDGHFL